MQFHYRVLIFFFLTSIFLCKTASSQLIIESTVKMLDDSSGWGVYIKPIDSHSPSGNVILLTGQVTIVAPTQYLSYPPKGFRTNVGGGLWNSNSMTVAPPENPDFDYLDLGFVIGSFPPSGFKSDEETLLFSFEKDGLCPGDISLMDRDTDPFSPENSTWGTSSGQNSAGNNPGVNLPMRDVGNGGIYNWLRNYSDCSDICSPCTGTNISAIDHSKEQIDLKIFPNPSAGIFNFNSSEYEFSKIKVYNHLGITVFEEKTPKSEIDLTTLSSGIYYLTFVTEEGRSFSEKILLID